MLHKLAHTRIIGKGVLFKVAALVGVEVAQAIVIDRLDVEAVGAQ